MSIKPALKLVTLDLDDTLWPLMPAMSRAESELKNWLTQHPSLSSGNIEGFDIPGIRQAAIDKTPSLRFAVTRLRQTILEDIFASAGVMEAEARSLAEEGIDLFLRLRHQVDLFPDARELLEWLASNFTLISITNGNANLARLGLDHYFDHSLSAESYGIGKPHKEIYHHALALAGVDAADALHIGDHPVDDLAGALSAGLHALWFNAGALPDTLEKQDHQLVLQQDALSDIPECLWANFSIKEKRGDCC